MKYFVETRISCEYFATYEAAEMFCAERGIHPEEIFEAEE